MSITLSTFWIVVVAVIACGHVVYWRDDASGYAGKILGSLALIAAYLIAAALVVGRYVFGGAP